MTEFGIRVMSDAATGRSVGPIKTWVREVDFDADSGHGRFEFTTIPGRAKRFESVADALMYWRTQSTRYPLRPDGEPNRPLTAFTVEVGELPGEVAIDRAEDDPVSDQVPEAEEQP